MTRPDTMVQELWSRWRAVGCEPVLVAVSGGGDSVALAAGLVEVARGLGRRAGARVELAHLDHALRPESATEAEQVRELAEQLEVPLRSRRLEPDEVRWIRDGTEPPPSGLDLRWVSEPGGPAKAGLQARARALRRSWLEACAAEQSCPLLALGHTLDDQAETVLLRLLRSSGSRGLSGMRLQGPGRAWRPLLAVRREAARDWLRRRDITWIEDPSNADEEISERVRVRKLALPALEQVRPGAAAALARAARRLAKDADALDEEAAAVTERLWGADGISVAEARGLSPAVRARLIDELSDRLGVPRPGAGLREAWLGLFEGDAGGRRLIVPGGVWARKQGRLRFEPSE